MARLANSLIMVALFSGLAACSGTGNQPKAASTACAPSAETGIVLPAGFCATVFADNIGHTRHMAMGDDGTLYVNSWSGRYFRGMAPTPAGGFLMALRDDDGDGKAETIVRFGQKSEDGGTGGMGIALYNGYVYGEAGSTIVRYKLPDQGYVPTGAAEVILTGLATDGNHNMHPILISKTGDLFVNMGSATNACQPEAQNRQPGVPGVDPCTELERRAGIWRYDANKENQAFSPKERYATGLRNAGGLAFDADGRFFATQHGRDQLSQLWPKFFTIEQGAESPAEELMEVHQGSDFGWPYCYYDTGAKKLLLAPEYGGDGKKEGDCATKEEPVGAYPAHMAPMAIAFHPGTGFPAAYAGGVFIAFHGSWNRAPLPQQGYDVYFQPMKDGKTAGEAIVFANGFAGGYRNPGQARFRPAGLAVGKDGALYVSDDVKGRIWRITYQGDSNAPLQAAPEPPPAKPLAEGELPPPPPGFTKANLELGRKIFLGEEKGGTCSGCHGNDLKGTPQGPALIRDGFDHSDGSIDGIAATIRAGVAHPKTYTTSVMPPNGGADLSPEDDKAIAAYIWALNHPAG